MRLPFWRPRRREVELDDELRSHLEMAVRDRVASGENRADAERAARRELGDLTRVREVTRDMWGWGPGERLARDVRISVRGLRRSPGFTAVIVLCLALGIGANAAVFSILDSLLISPLPVANPGELVTFEQLLPGGRRQYNISFKDFEHFDERLEPVLTGMTAITWADRYSLAVGGSTERSTEGQVRVSVVTGNYFAVMGVNARTGRTFDVRDDEAGANPTVVISDTFWRERFNGNLGAIGRTLTVSGTTFTVIGIMPAGFTGEWVGRPTHLWIPVAMLAQVTPEFGAGERGGRFQYKVIARMKPGVTIAQVQAAGDAVFQQLISDPPPNSGLSRTARFQAVSAAAG